MQRRPAALVTVGLLFPDLAGEQQGVGIELEAVADLAVEFATRFEVLRQPQQVPVGVCLVSVFARALRSRLRPCFLYLPGLALLAFIAIDLLK